MKGKRIGSKNMLGKKQTLKNNGIKIMAVSLFIIMIATIFVVLLPSDADADEFAETKLEGIINIPYQIPGHCYPTLGMSYYGKCADGSIKNLNGFHGKQVKEENIEELINRAILDELTKQENQNDLNSYNNETFSNPDNFTTNENITGNETESTVDLINTDGIEPLRIVQLSCGQFSSEVNPGETASFNVEIQNTGELRENVRFKINNLPSGWTARLNKWRVGLNPGDTESIVVTLTAPDEVDEDVTIEPILIAESNEDLLRLGNQRFRVNVVSAGASGKSGTRGSEEENESLQFSSDLSIRGTRSGGGIEMDFLPTGDAYVLSAYPNNNYGSEDWLIVIHDPDEHGFVHFDISSIPSYAEIVKADLHLHTAAVWGDFMYGIKYANSSWTESGVTWNNQPSSSDIPGYPGFGGHEYSDGRHYIIDVTNAVEAWHSGSRTNYGFCIDPVLIFGYGINACVRSRENYPGPGLVVYIDVRPELISPVDEWTSDGTPTLTWEPRLPPETTQIGYHVQVDSDSLFGSPEKDSGEVSSSDTSWTVPEPALSDGEWYWRARIQYSNGEWSDWADPAWFGVDTTPPNISLVSLGNLNNLIITDNFKVVADASDDGCGLDKLWYTIDSETIKYDMSFNDPNYEGLVSAIPFDVRSTHDVVLHASDLLGNETTPSGNVYEFERFAVSTVNPTSITDENIIEIIEEFDSSANIDGVELIVKVGEWDEVDSSQPDEVVPMMHWMAPNIYRSVIGPYNTEFDIVYRLKVTYTSSQESSDDNAIDGLKVRIADRAGPIIEMIEVDPEIPKPLQNINLTFQIYDKSPIDSDNVIIKYSVDLGQTWTWTVLQNGLSYNYYHTISGSDIPSESIGQIRIEVTAVDVYGNSNTDKFIVALDTGRPSLSGNAASQISIDGDVLPDSEGWQLSNLTFGSYTIDLNGNVISTNTMDVPMAFNWDDTNLYCAASISTGGVNNYITEFTIYYDGQANFDLSTGADGVRVYNDGTYDDLHYNGVSWAIDANNDASAAIITGSTTTIELAKPYGTELELAEVNEYSRVNFAVIIHVNDGGVEKILTWPNFINTVDPASESEIYSAIGNDGNNTAPLLWCESWLTTGIFAIEIVNPLFLDNSSSETIEFNISVFDNLDRDITTRINPANFSLTLVDPNDVEIIVDNFTIVGGVLKGNYYFELDTSEGVWDVKVNPFSDGFGNATTEQQILQFIEIMGPYIIIFSMEKQGYLINEIVPFDAIVSLHNDPSNYITTDLLLTVSITDSEGTLMGNSPYQMTHNIDNIFELSVDTTGWGAGEYTATLTVDSPKGIFTKELIFMITNDYTISINVASDHPRNNEVIISGFVLENGTTGIENVPINVLVTWHLPNLDIPRTLEATSNASGYYEISFYPYSTEAGSYTARASATWNALVRDTSTTFNIHGLLIHESPMVHSMVSDPGNPITEFIDITLENLGDNAIDISNVTPSPPENGITLAVESYPPSIEPHETGILTLSVTDDGSASEKPGTDFVYEIEYTANSGSVGPYIEEGLITVVVHANIGVLETSDSSFDVNVISKLIDHSEGAPPVYMQDFTGCYALRTVNLVNQGYGNLTNVKIIESDINDPEDLVKLTKDTVEEEVSPGIFQRVLDVGTINSDGEYEFELEISGVRNDNGPGPIPPGTYVVDIVIEYYDGSTTSSDTITLNIDVVDETKTTGNLNFYVNNEFDTSVSGALVTLIYEDKPPTFDPTDPVQRDKYIKTGVTGSPATFDDLEVGEWDYVITANGYETETGTVTVEPAASGGDYQDYTEYVWTDFIEYNWAVNPIKIIDEYQIILQGTFGGQFYVAVLLPKPSTFEIDMFPTPDVEEFIVGLTLLNVGGISAFDVSIGTLSYDVYTIEPLVNSIEEVKPHQSVSIPMKITKSGKPSQYGHIGNILVNWSYIYFDEYGTQAQGYKHSKVPVRINKIPSKMAFMPFGFYSYTYVEEAEYKTLQYLKDDLGAMGSELQDAIEDADVGRVESILSGAESRIKNILDQISIGTLLEDPAIVTATNMTDFDIANIWLNTPMGSGEVRSGGLGFENSFKFNAYGYVDGNSELGYHDSTDLVLSNIDLESTWGDLKEYAKEVVDLTAKAPLYFGGLFDTALNGVMCIGTANVPYRWTYNGLDSDTLPILIFIKWWKSPWTLALPLFDLDEQQRTIVSPPGSSGSGSLEEGDGEGDEEGMDPIFNGFRSSEYVQETAYERIKFQITQRATFERDGFKAKLNLQSKVPDKDITNVNVSIIIKNQDGTDVTNTLFWISSPTVLNLDGGVLEPLMCGNLEWLIIPVLGAGGIGEGMEYFAEAHISFDIEVEGVNTTFNGTTNSLSIIVRPQPALELDYLLPLGEELSGGNFGTIVPIAVRVKNTGAGTARNFQIESAQPIIPEDGNPSGALIDFRIVGTWCEGQSVSTTGMTINFGNIEPGEEKIGYWKLQVVGEYKTGEFEEFEATWTHSDALGGERTALITSVTTGDLEYWDLPFNSVGFVIDNPDVPDPNPVGIPDRIYSSTQGYWVPLTDANDFDSSVNGGIMTINLTSVYDNWIYLDVVEPEPLSDKDPEGNYLYPIFKIERSDGTILEEGSYLRKDNEIRIFDNLGEIAKTETYFVYYNLTDFDIEVQNITTDPGLISEGESVVISADIVNNGTGPSADLYVTFYVGTNMVGDVVTIPPLPPGGLVNVSATENWTPYVSQDYNIRVEVTDLTSYNSDTAIVTVNNVAPVVNTFTNTAPAIPDQLVAFTVNISDPGLGFETYTYEFDWDNDGDYDETVSDSDPMMTVDHSFSQPGIYTVVARVYDGEDYSLVSTTDAIIYVVINTTQSTYHTTIQDAIDSAVSGNVLKTESWIFSENIVINKDNLELIGKDPETTVINSGGTGNVVEISANGVTIRNFAICQGDIGLYLGSAQNAVIKDCIVSINDLGIHMDSASQNNEFYHNSVSNLVTNAQDDGSGNLWDDGSSGNWWHDYDGVDVNPPYGIGDTPYDISGSAGSQDRYPITDNQEVKRVYNQMKGIWYYTIQSAINDADQGDDLFATSSIYYETIVINKSVTLTGEDKLTTFINGTGAYEDNVYITADNVELSGFTVQNAHPVRDGIDVRSNNVLITDNIVTNCYHGILLVITADCTVLNNTVYNCSNNAIYLSGARPNNTVEGNTVYDSGYGIILRLSSNSNTVKDNLVYDIANPGIHLYDSDGNTISGNEVYNTRHYGIDLQLSHYNILHDNYTHDNIASGYGVHVHSSSHDNTFFSNTITSNTIGFYIDSSSYDNTIYHNNFIGNTTQAHDDGTDNLWNREYAIAGNYWYDWGEPDDFRGDLQDIPGSDGIIDDGLPHGGLNPYPHITGSALSEDTYPLKELFDPNEPWYRVKNITQNLWYKYIQDAVDEAVVGDVIEAYSSTFYENVVVDKTLTIRNATGETPILDGGDNGHGFYLEGIDNATISGFTIQNCNHPTPDYYTWYSGIHIMGVGSTEVHADNNTIEDNTIINCNVGVYTRGWGPGGRIKDNNILNNNISYTSRAGIFVAYSDYTTIDGNTVQYNSNYNLAFAGILAISSQYSTVSNNYVMNNESQGIYIQTPDTTISGNEVHDNDSVGLRIEGIRNEIFDNEIYNHSHYGGAIALRASDNNLYQNNIHDNNRGIRSYVPGGTVSGNHIFQNTIENNTYGIEIIFDTVDNYIYNNSFLFNTIQASDVNANYWDSGYPPEGTGGNYWSDYEGVDLMSGPNQTSPGPDGFGDTPYFIDSNSIDHYPLMDPYFRVHNVTRDSWHYFIQDAVDKASSDNEIEAYSYIFFENVNVTKTLTIRNATGEVPILDGGNDGHGFYLEGIDNAIISGFTIQNCNHPSPDFYTWYSGIHIMGVGSTDVHADNNTIEDNTILNCDVGIYTRGWGPGGRIKFNKILNNNTSFTNRAGIFVAYSDFSIIDGNTVQFNYNYSSAFAGIHAISSQYSTILNNYVMNNESQGIFLQTPDIIVSGNEVHDNDSVGLRIEGINNEIFDNEIYNHSYYAGAIALRASDNRIYQNNIYNNNKGIRIEVPGGTVSGNHIFENIIENNVYGIEIIFDSMGNYIYNNNFLFNIIQAKDVNANHWDSGYPPEGTCGNYWSNYTGPDNFSGPNQNIPGPDGIIDIPYIIDANSIDRYPYLNPLPL
jgi:parallel beta-helix repeat protein